MHGQIVIGPPGSGKSTFCKAMKNHFTANGRKVVTINLDPANEDNECDIDVRELIELGEVTERLGLGPNGGLIFCIEYFADNLSWLKDSIDDLDDSHYLLFDCPGQVELYIHNEAMQKVVHTITEDWGIRLAAVNLIDSMQCHEPSKYISALAMSLSTMLQLELPHINVLSKIDLLERTSDQLPYKIDYFTEVMDLEFLTSTLAEDPFTARFGSLTAAIAGLVEDFGLVQFHPLNVNDTKVVANVARVIDRANGYMFGPSEYNEPEFRTPEEK